MVSGMQYLIVAAISVNDVPYVPTSKNMKAAIGHDEAMKFAKIDDTETLAAGASDAANFM